MIRPALLSFIMVASPFPVRGADPAKPADYSVTLAAAKDVPAVASLLHEQLHIPVDLMLSIKDADSLAKAKTAMEDASVKITAIAKHLKTLPVPSSAERAALTKQMDEADKTKMKAKQPAIKAHLDAMPAELKAEARTQMSAFYQALETHRKVFDSYFKPDPAPSKDAEKPAGKP